MSLDVYLQVTKPCDVYSANITHNLNKMADLVGLYQPLWRPDEIGVTTAKQLIPLLREGIAKLVDNKEEAEKLNPSNGWGSYDSLLRFARDYLTACEDNPEATVNVSR